MEGSRGAGRLGELDPEVGPLRVAPVVLHFDGHSWRVEAVPPPRPAGVLSAVEFFGVSALPNGEAWAAGSFTAEGMGLRPLVYRRVLR